MRRWPLCRRSKSGPFFLAAFGAQAITAVDLRENHTRSTQAKAATAARRCEPARPRWREQQAERESEGAVQHAAGWCGSDVDRIGLSRKPVHLPPTGRQSDFGGACGDQREETVDKMGKRARQVDCRPTDRAIQINRRQRDNPLAERKGGVKRMFGC
jgi:hypothetical protein